MSSHEEYIAGLREYADLLEANPGLPRTTGEYFCWPCTSSEQMVATVRLFGGQWDKRTSEGSDYFTLERFIGPHRISVYTARENVCERVVIGTETVEIPDPELVADVPLVTVEQDVVRWVCPESLLADAGS